ncbi:hypothetical protein K435DRAFT_342122 [Dendrothele bispora CBS 962.96]|uniref:Uncharacterized protein n=1 Tax=Dendrothele bispora (strain CBS 962.96) TaxID=1314807 RepID=A0A4V4HDJ7_DENBC|nr:hypothetical protein K435DRAFT_342122 [Dendrothele bispora CBS 962.96]
MACYRSNLCLLYPPHLIAVAATYLTLVLNPSHAQATLNHFLPSSSVNNTAETSPHSTEEPGTVIASSSHFQSNADTTLHQSSCQSSQTQTPTQLPQTQGSTSRSLSLSSPPFHKNSSRSTLSRTDIAKKVNDWEQTTTQAHMVGQNFCYLPFGLRSPI